MKVNFNIHKDTNIEDLNPSVKYFNPPVKTVLHRYPINVIPTEEKGTVLHINYIA